MTVRNTPSGLGVARRRPWVGSGYHDGEPELVGRPFRAVLGATGRARRCGRIRCVRAGHGTTGQQPRGAADVRARVAQDHASGIGIRRPGGCVRASREGGRRVADRLRADAEHSRACVGADRRHRLRRGPVPRRRQGPNVLTLDDGTMRLVDWDSAALITPLQDIGALLAEIRRFDCDERRSLRYGVGIVRQCVLRPGPNLRRRGLVAVGAD